MGPWHGILQVPNSGLQNGKALASAVTLKNGPTPQSEEPVAKDSSDPSFETTPKCDWCPYSNLCGMGVK
jgi:hypothetical protein